VNSSDDAILSKDLDGVITSWNAGAERIFGYTTEEAIGKPVTMLMPPERYNEEPDILARIRRGLRIDHYQTVRRRKDGSLLDISLSVSPIKDAQGKVIGASKIARDITETKRAETELRQAKENLALLNAELGRAKAGLEREVLLRTAELRRTNQQLEELVYAIAHDLRAPLRAMQAFAKMLLEDYGRHLDELGQDYCQRIVRASANMDALVRDLLAYGRVARADMPLGTVSLQTAWEEAVSQNEPVIRERNARLEPSLPLPKVVGHHGTLTQVLANLISNGLKFVDAGTTPHLRFWAEEKDLRTVTIYIKDNGIGIGPQYLDRVFRVFERLDGDRYPGTGIGLSIVRKGVERMGGQVGAESKPGEGSLFWIRLTKAPGE
jgi:PAS domain S-box-containing protein